MNHAFVTEKKFNLSQSSVKYYISVNCVLKSQENLQLDIQTKNNQA